MVPAGLIGGDLGLLLNTGNARLAGSRRVVVDTVGATSGLAVLSTERGTIGPRYGRRGEAGTEWDLRVGSVISFKGIEVRDKRVLTVKVSGIIFPSRNTVSLTESTRGTDRLANWPRT